MNISFVLLLLLILLLIAEKYAIAKKTRRIKIRILVNGTRGKSTVTRYIAAAVRRSGYSVMAKITGVVPTVFYPNGERKAIKRLGSPRVQEQFKIIRSADYHKVDCLVLECMSIAPELQQLESRHFKPHVYVITNIKDDHMEKAGKTISEQIDSICSAIPFNAKIVTVKSNYLEKIKQTAERRNSSVTVADDFGRFITSELPNKIYRDNILLAIAAADLIGLKSEDSLPAAIEEAATHKKSLIDLNDCGKNVKFIDGFAINDVPSANDFVNNYLSRYDDLTNLIVILNTRVDRPLRSLAFVNWLRNYRTPSKIIITGNHGRYTSRALSKGDMAKDKIIFIKGKDILNIKALLIRLNLRDTLVAGLGNIGGQGFSISQILAGDHYQHV
ncbi:MAG: poly-gamma-glutamate synthase PgsB [Candidatus Zixiibacteriota bacterium]